MIEVREDTIGVLVLVNMRRAPLGTFEALAVESS
jgi:hypothetical protein